MTEDWPITIKGEKRYMAHKKKPMQKKVLKHLKEDIKKQKQGIKEDIKLGKSIKSGCKK